MTASQIERLKRDSRELDHCIAKYVKRGQNDKVGKLKRKRAFLDQTISDTRNLQLN